VQVLTPDLGVVTLPQAVARTLLEVDQRAHVIDVMPTGFLYFCCGG
jgi:hypothetical protein